jgi:hypothetical protein
MNEVVILDASDLVARLQRGELDAAGFLAAVVDLEQSQPGGAVRFDATR